METPTAPPTPWPAFACVAMGVFMATLDSSIVHVALPVIRRDLGTTLAIVEWVPNAYLLVITGLLLTFGRLADIHGQRRVYRMGLGVFTVGSGLCALAPTALALIAARGIQGMGAAMIMACTPAIVTAVFPEAHRGRALGLVGTTVALGLTTGPALGGLLLDATGWRSLFAINLPVGTAAWMLAGRTLPPLRFARRPEGFDLVGALLLSAGLTLVLLAINRAGAWGATAAAASGATGVALLAAFAIHEGRARDPLVDLGLFRSRGFSAAVVAATLSYLAGFVAVLLIPFYLSELRGLAPRTMGLYLTVPPLVMSLVAPWAGSLSDRIGYGRLTAAGLVVRSGSLLALLSLGPATPTLWVLSALGLLGAGSALFSPPNTSSIMGGVPDHRLGVAGAIAAVARNLGMMLGIGVGGMVFTAFFRGAGGVEVSALSPGFREAFVVGWRAAMAVGFASCLAALGASLLRGASDAVPVRPGPRAP